MGDSVEVSVFEQVRAFTGLEPADCPLARLERILGGERVAALLEAALTSAGLKTVSTPQDLLALGGALSAGQAGMVDVAGRALRIEALLRGAKPLP